MSLKEQKSEKETNSGTFVESDSNCATSEQQILFFPFPPNFKIESTIAKIRKNVIIKKAPVVFSERFFHQPISYNKEIPKKVDDTLYYSKLILPCFIFLTEDRSIHSILNDEEISNANFDPIPKLESLFPSLSCEFYGFFKNSHSQLPQYTHNAKYFNFKQSCANLSDDDVITLTSKIKCCLKCNYSYARTMSQCTEYISCIEGTEQYFSLFIESLFSPKTQNDIIPLSRTRSISKRTLVQIKQLQYKHKKLYHPIQSVSATPNNNALSNIFQTSLNHISHEMDDCSEPPSYIELPSYEGRKIPSEKDPHVTKSYIRQQTVLQQHLSDALLFNSQYVSLFSGSEGGSNSDQSGRDEQLIKDQEDYFLATHYIPDAQVIVNRIEKTIYFLTQEEDPYQKYLFPGFLIGAIRDLYGPSDSYTIFKALKTNREMTKEVILPRLIEARNNYYSKEREWDEFHAYEHSLFGMQMVMKKQEIDLCVPDTVELNEQQFDLLSNFLIVCTELYFKSRSNDQIHSIRKNVVAFFDLLSKMSQEPHKEPKENQAFGNVAYIPFIVVSALKLLPAIIDSLNSFEKTLEPHFFEDYKTKILINLEITQTELRGITFGTSMSTLDTFIASDATKIMKLVAMHISTLDTFTSLKGNRKPDIVVFGNDIGQNLLHRILSFVGIFEMCDIRNEFLPLCDIYNEYYNSNTPLDKYLETAKKICPFRGLYSITKREFGSIFEIDFVHKNISTPLSLPVLLLPSPNIEEEK